MVTNIPDMTRDKSTGLAQWWLHNLLCYFPVLKNRGKFLIGQMRMDGALIGWIVGLEEKEMLLVEDFSLEAQKECYLPRVKTLKVVSDLMSNGWIVAVFEKSEKEKIAEHVAYTEKAMKAKTYKQMCDTIADSGILGKNVVTGDDVWNSLPKNLFTMKLGEWHAAAVAVMEKRV